MKVVIDTNVLMSGIFFNGPPYNILQLWQKKKLTFLVSEEILGEYFRVANELSQKMESGSLEKIITLLSINAIMVNPPKLKEQVCSDQDDDKFIECALAGGVSVIISGDKHLLTQNGVFGLSIVSPRDFLTIFYHPLR